MLTMKITLALLVCSIIGILEVKSQPCVPQAIQNFDPNGLSGAWYLVYVKPNIFTQVSDVIENITYVEADKQLVGTLTLTMITDPPSAPEVHDTEMDVTNNVLDVNFVGLPQFDSIYKVVATDYNQYMIKQGNPSATAPDDLTVIYMRQPCGDPASIAAATAAVNSQCWTISQFTKAPTCPP